MKIANCFGTRFSGKFGDCFIAYCRHGVNYIRPYVKPSDPRTPSQERLRATFKEAVHAWHRLTDLQRHFYDRMSQRMSGYNLFVGRYVKAVLNGIDPEVPRTVKWTVLDGSLSEDGRMTVHHRGRLIFSVSLSDRQGEIALTRSDGPYRIALDKAHAADDVLMTEGTFETETPVTLENRGSGFGLRLSMIGQAARSQGGKL